MTGSSNKDILLRFVKEHFTPPEFAMELCTPDFTVHWAWGGEIVGVAHVAAVLENFLKVFSGLCVKISRARYVLCRTRLLDASKKERRIRPSDMLKLVIACDLHLWYHKSICQNIIPLIATSALLRSEAFKTHNRLLAGTFSG
jgi:hypothetical protein